MYICSNVPSNTHPIILVASYVGGRGISRTLVGLQKPCYETTWCLSQRSVAVFVVGPLLTSMRCWRLSGSVCLYYMVHTHRLRRWRCLFNLTSESVRELGYNCYWMALQWSSFSRSNQLYSTVAAAAASATADSLAIIAADISYGRIRKRRIYQISRREVAVHAS